MIPYTTPTLTLTVGADLTGMDVYVTIQQGSTLVTIEDAEMEYDGTKTSIAVTLTQEQTALFSRGSCDVQVNWLDANERRSATQVRSVPIGTQLLREVLPEEGGA